MNKLIKKITGIFLISISFCTGIFAQNSETEQEVIKLSIEEAVDFAIKNSRTLKSSDIDLEIKKRASSNSWNVFIPTLSVNGIMSRTSSFTPGTQDIIGAAFSQMTGMPYKMPTDFEKEEDRWSTLGQVSAGWNFTPAYISQIQIAKANYESGIISWEQNQKETVMNIKKIYYGLLLQQESLKIQKISLENARQRMNQAEANFKNGLCAEIQLLQTQVNYENTKPSVISAEQAINQQFDLFAFMIGLPVGSKIELTSSIEPAFVEVNADELLEKYGKNDLSIRSLEKTIEVAKLGVTALNLSTWVPVLAVNYSYQPVYIGKEGAFHFYKDLGDDDSWHDSGSLSLTLVWNLANMLPWSSNRQKVKDTKQQLRQAEIGLETLKENQKVQVRKFVDTLNQAKEQIDSMSRNVTLAQKAYDMQLKSYRNGTTELLDLRDAESSLNQAKLGQLNQKFQYISALMDLENTLNTSLTN